jgi:hypothetical protein
VTLRADQALEGFPVVEKSRGPAFVQPAVPRGGVHAQTIGAGAAFCDPWRE